MQLCGAAILGKAGILGATEGVQSQTMLSIAFGAVSKICNSSVKTILNLLNGHSFRLKFHWYTTKKQISSFWGLKIEGQGQSCSRLILNREKSLFT